MSENGRNRTPLGVTPRIVALCARQQGVAGGEQIVELGLSRQGIRKRVRAQTLFEIYEDVYALSPVVSPHGYRAAACLAVPRGRTMLAGWSAAEAYRMAPRPDHQHHIATTRRVRDRRGLVVHHTRAEIGYRRIRGVPVTEPLRVLVDLAVELNGRPLQQLVGEALYIRVVRDHDIETVAQRYPGHPGLANLGAISPKEARERRTVLPLANRMLLALDDLPILPPICEHRVAGHSGKGYRADFAWPDRGIILEADGRTSHERREQMEYDRFRDADLLLAGWQTVRVTTRQFARERRRFDETMTLLVGV